MDSIELCLPGKGEGVAYSSSLSCRRDSHHGVVGGSYSVFWFRASSCWGDYLFHCCPLVVSLKESERVGEADKTQTQERTKERQRPCDNMTRRVRKREITPIKRKLNVAVCLSSPAVLSGLISLLRVILHRGMGWEEGRRDGSMNWEPEKNQRKTLQKENRHSLVLLRGVLLFWNSITFCLLCWNGPPLETIIINLRN